MPKWIACRPVQSHPAGPNSDPKCTFCENAFLFGKHYPDQKCTFWGFQASGVRTSEFWAKNDAHSFNESSGDLHGVEIWPIYCCYRKRVGDQSVGPYNVKVKWSKNAFARFARECVRSLRSRMRSLASLAKVFARFAREVQVVLILRLALPRLEDLKKCIFGQDLCPCKGTG